MELWKFTNSNFKNYTSCKNPVRGTKTCYGLGLSMLELNIVLLIIQFTIANCAIQLHGLHFLNYWAPTSASTAKMQFSLKV